MLRSYLSRALRIDPKGKPKLYAQIYESAGIGSARYLLDLIFSAGIATLGLVLNSPAVVIGAMLISPLMGPIMASGLAFAASDVYLGVKALLGIVGSVITAICFSALLVWLLPFQSPTSEILARTQPNLLDLGVAIFSGLAGSVIMARSMSGGTANALPGVAIAVALMPPLCTAGFGVGSGWNWQIISGATLLFLTNLVAISASAFLVLYMVGMDSPEIAAAILEEERREAGESRLHAIFYNSALGKLFSDVGQMRWRIAMVAVTIAVLFVPLRSSLLHLRDETIIRAAARELVRYLAGTGQVLSQQLEIFPDHLVQRMVTTSPVDKQRLAEAERELTRRTGRKASIQVRQVANEDDLITLRERLLAPESIIPVPPSLESLAPSLWPLVDEPLKSVWPAEAADLSAYEVSFSKEAIAVRMKYHAPQALAAAAQEAIRNALRRTLGVDNMNAEFEWQGPREKKNAPK